MNHPDYTYPDFVTTYKHNCNNNDNTSSDGMIEEKSETHTCVQCQNIIRKIQELQQCIDEHISLFRIDVVRYNKMSYVHIDAIQLINCKIKELQQLLQ
jgi:hypothetical protein